MSPTRASPGLHLHTQSPKASEGRGKAGPPPTPPAAAVTPRRPRLTHPRRRRPLPREAGREPPGPRGVRRGGERGESWGRRLLPAKAAAVAPQLLGRWRRMERGGRGEERGRLGGPPPSSSPPVLPPTPLSLWPPGARCCRREGRRRLQGREGGSRPSGRAAALERAAAAAAAGGGRRRAGGGAGRRRRRRLYLGIGYRLQIQFITRKHRSGGGPGPAARPQGGGSGPSVQNRRPRTAASLRLGDPAAASPPPPSSLRGLPPKLLAAAAGLVVDFEENS